MPVVAIGASAGGLEALEELFEKLPADTGMAFVVVTHQHPGHTSLLPELLGKCTTMNVVEAADGTRLGPNRVYVAPPGGYLAILNRSLHRMQIEQEKAPHLPIDYFFRSLAEDQKERAICIVLSGTGTDGTLGLEAVKAESGMCMAQQPQSAKYDSMPASAIRTGLADYVLPPAAMPKQLMAYVQAAYLAAGAATREKASALAAEPLQKIFVLLRNRTGHDFSGYKNTTIQRRIERRMNVHQIERPGQYLLFLQENPHELDILFKELLISVTNFFRDPEAWQALAPRLDALLKSRADNGTLRAWLPGCATGEEAYTLAIALREAMERTKRRMDVQIFGTDLDTEAIEIARAGQYPEGIAVDLAPERLERWFQHADSTYRIRKEIREMVVFAPQNVIKDPPFTKLDILSCRNLLIYLNADLQRKLLPIFHYTLKPGALMLLGPSETVGHFTELFEALDKRWKIFRRRESAHAIGALPPLAAQPALPEEPAPVPASPAAALKARHVTSQIERLLLGRFAPASIVINERGDIVYIHGRTGAWLEPVPGEPRNNLLEMAREGLQLELSGALRECLRKGTEIVRAGIRIHSNGEATHVDLAVARIAEPESLRGLLLVTLRPAPPRPEPAARRRTRTGRNDTDRHAQLGRELQFLKESHQTALEELETSNEELQSTNEELQSTNEELETSKEEMQSLNEELTTVNSQLQVKVEELSQINDDMQNLLNSTDIATVFLDNDLNIKRFTAKATDLVMLRQSDVGRPIRELASSLQADDLVDDCARVLQTLVFREAEVRTESGGSYLMRIMPYRTSQNVIDGLVLTFVNIGRLERVGRDAATARHHLAAIVDTVREPLLVLNGELRVVGANRAFYGTFEGTQEQAAGELVYRLGAGRWDIPKLHTLLEEILPKRGSVEDYELPVTSPKLGRRVFLLNARRLMQPGDAGGQILLAFEDRTRN